MELETIEVGSLFTGIAGIEQGLEKAGGFETIWHCETDPYASAVLRKHKPSVPNLGDITKVDWTKVRRPDLICGGFPCQDISNAGKRAGITGKRSGLWKEYAKAIGILRPRYVFIENVSALLGRGLDVVLADLASCGYDAEWDCIPAQAVGAPHRRDRLFIVAYTPSQRLYHKENKRIVESERSNELLSIQSRDTGNVAYPNSKWKLQQERNKQNKRKWTCNCGADVSNTNSFRCEQCRTETRPRERIIAWNSSQRELIRKRGKQNWAVEPDICRVVNGLPNRVHRIKCLGNSVVPQIAEFIAERIKEREGMKWAKRKNS